MPTKQVSVGTSQVKLLDADPTRSAILISNTHSTAILYVSDNEVATTNGFPIQPLTTLLLSFSEGVEVDKRINAISDTASTTVGIWEHHQKREAPEPSPIHDLQEPGNNDPNM